MARRAETGPGWLVAGVTGFFLLLGIGLAVFGGHVIWTTRAFLVEATEVTGTVIEENISCDDEGCTWWPVFRITTPRGETVEVPTRFGSGGYDFGMGAEVEVLFHPAYDYVRIAGQNPYIEGIVMLGFGTVMTLMLGFAFRMVVLRGG